jgi:membrane protein implicated in regulation of membrane protease activity
MMKRLDAVLLGIVFVVWGALALMYATIPMIQMPTSFRVWGLGALLFLVLTILAAYAVRKRQDN